MYYILKGHQPVLEKDSLKWSKWFETIGEGRVVANTILRGKGITVSTIFLGIDHSFTAGSENPRHNPILFETVVFGGNHDGEMDRCSTWDNAQQMHADMLYKVTSIATEDVRSEKEIQQATIEENAMLAEELDI